MRIPGFKRNTISFDMFDFERSAAEAKRFNKCENIYHRGQDLAWNGKEVLDMLVAKHGQPQLSDKQRTALQRVFAIILWGELAAWRISAQLADRIEPLEAKMAATSQVHDEARHFYVMYDYLSMLGAVPTNLDFAPKRLIELVLNADSLAYKIIGMQLMIETLALTIFQSVRLAAPEPVLTELLKYFEKDEARHVGLGMQYLPILMKDMNKVQIAGLFTFQAKILSYGMWETKVIENDLRELGISARDVIDRGRAKQMVVLRDTFESLGIQGDRGFVLTFFSVTGELFFPSEETQGNRKAQWRAAWRSFRGEFPDTDEANMRVHEEHEIVTVRDSLQSRLARPNSQAQRQE